MQQLPITLLQEHQQFLFRNQHEPKLFQHEHPTVLVDFSY